MKRSRYSPEQVAFGLRQAEEGTPVAEVCRKMGIAEQTFYRWKKKFQGMGVAEVRRRPPSYRPPEYASCGVRSLPGPRPPDIPAPDLPERC